MGPFAVIGYPVSDSMSPALFRAAYPQFPKDTYRYIETTCCTTALEQMKALGILAANITAPLKTDCITYAQTVSAKVRQIGAANLLVRENDTWSAMNTDVFGVLESFRANGIQLKGQHALVIGAGGAGRAAAWVLEASGARVYVVNRTLHKTHLYALEEIPQWLPRCALVVNTVPAALDNRLFRNLTGYHTVLDASYKTAPLQEAALRSKSLYLNGYHWLYHQGVVSFRTMTGLEPDTTSMRRLLGL
ncbi:MAG: NAD(P)-dependent oxidoreductase [Bacteroidales bacterium]